MLNRHAIFGTALTLGVLASASSASAQLTTARDMYEEFMQNMNESYLWQRTGDELVFGTTKFFIEFNETDQDIGVQCVLGGEPYMRLRAYDPSGRLILQLRPQHTLNLQGLSDFFFESVEPTLDELSMNQFLSRFPEGEYEFLAVTIDRELQEGETEFTHNIPAGPVIVYPQEGDVVDADDLVIQWEPVTLTTAFNPPQVPVNIVAYQVIVTQDEPKRVFDVTLSPDVTEVRVPAEFLDEGTEYELEILAVEESDNQTISLLFFETEEGDE